MKEQEIDILDIMFVIIMIAFVIMMAWWVLGNSPTLQMLGTFLSFVFLILAFKNDKDIGNLREDMKEVKDNTGKTLNKLDRLDDIYNVLKERLR